MKEILFIDTETGGIDPEIHDLLSVGLVCWRDGDIEATQEIFLEFDENRISKRSLEYSHFDLDRSRTVSQKQAIREILQFINKNFSNKLPLTVGGHNTGFDVSFLKRLFKTNDTVYEKYFSHRLIDTAGILQYLHFCGIIEEPISSFDDACHHFEIHVKHRHMALDDALATAKVFNRLLKLGKSQIHRSATV